MSSPAADLSWDLLRRVVREWAGGSAELASVQPLDGGSISTTVKLETSRGDRAVLKISPHRVDRTYEREAHQLQVLRRLGLPVPGVLALHGGSLDEPHSYVLLEFVNGVDLAEARRLASPEQYDALQEQFAELVAAMHRCTSDHYGRVMPAEHAGQESWPAFYRRVYDAIWQACERNGHLPGKMRKLIGRVHDRLESLIAHDDCPRLTHWDLWSANILTREVGGRWQVAALLDPNCKYAHHEAELAYIDLFHTGTPAFFRAYQKAFRLPDGYHRVRKCVYQMYELVNHVHLFGQEYVKPLGQMLERLSPLV